MILEYYERTDYKVLAKEFGCLFCIGKKGIKLFTKDLLGFKLIRIIPLDGWYTDQKSLKHIVRENGLEL